MRAPRLRVLRASTCLALCGLLAAGTGAAEGSPAGQPASLLAGDGLLESFSLSADRGPVHVESSTLEFEYRTGQLRYQGGVKVNQADIELTSDTLTVTLDVRQGGRPREIVAEGNVRIVSGERVATGGRAVFDHDKQTITLSEEAVLRDGPNEVAGDRVVVFLNEQRSVVDGGGERVRATLFPGGMPSLSGGNDE